jgi:hypothetical protein
MTNRDFLKNISANENLTAEMREHAEKMLAQMDSALAKRKEKPSKTAVANEPIKANIFEWLTKQSEPVVASVVGEAMEISVQKASSLLRTLRDEGKVEQSEVKVPKKGVQKAYKVKVGE